jgi:hypothetical protein
VHSCRYEDEVKRGQQAATALVLAAALFAGDTAAAHAAGQGDLLDNLLKDAAAGDSWKLLPGRATCIREMEANPTRRASEPQAPMEPKP